MRTMGGAVQIRGGETQLGRSTSAPNDGKPTTMGVNGRESTIIKRAALHGQMGTIPGRGKKENKWGGRKKNT